MKTIKAHIIRVMRKSTLRRSFRVESWRVDGFRVSADLCPFDKGLIINDS